MDWSAQSQDLCWGDTSSSVQREEPQEPQAGKTQIFKVVTGDFKVKTSPTQPVLQHISCNSKCRAGKRSSINKKAVDIPPAERISHYLINWQKLTLNQDILSVLKGIKMPFIKIPFQRKILNFTRMNMKLVDTLVDFELKEMFRKGTIKGT